MNGISTLPELEKERGLGRSSRRSTQIETNFELPLLK